MHFGKEIIKNLFDDVDGESFFYCLGIFLFMCLIFGILGMGVHSDNSRNERLEYKQVMDEQCSKDADSEICKLASHKYFDVKEKTWTDSPIVWVTATIVVILLLVLVFW